MFRVLKQSFSLLRPIQSIVPFQLNQKIVFNFSHVIKSKNRTKGMLKTRLRTADSSLKKKSKKRILKNHKGLNHNALLRRVGPRWNRQFKYKPVGKRHLNRNSSRANLKRKKYSRLIHPHDLRKVRKMIPNYKFQKFRDLH